MKIRMFVLLLACSFCCSEQGFFSKFTNRMRNGNNKLKEDFVDTCETVRVMPRIAMAVVGGVPLRVENSAPYIAALGERTSNGSLHWFCGGSLISTYDILTAAHCLVSRNVSVVKVGSFSTEKRSDGENYQVLDTFIHPGYKITESYNDIAIIKVKNQIGFDVNIKPICLPQDDKDTYEKDRARVVGWGAEEFGGERSEALQQVEVEVFSNANCEKAYRNSTLAPRTFPKGIKPEQLCAGSKKGGKDACQGDSGGPLVLSDEHGIVRQIGIVSTGAGCGSKIYPGVYARVSSYVDWIRQHVKNSPQETWGKNQSLPNNQPSIISSGQEKPQKKNSESRPSHNQGSNFSRIPGNQPSIVSTGQEKPQKKNSEGRPSHNQGSNFSRIPENSREVNSRENGNFQSNQKRKLDRTRHTELEKGFSDNTERYGAENSQTSTTRSKRFQDSQF